jgi:hypothetical protein
MLASLLLRVAFVLVLMLLPLFDCHSGTKYVHVMFSQQCLELVAIWVLKCRREGGDGAYIIGGG